MHTVIAISQFKSTLLSVASLSWILLESFVVRNGSQGNLRCGSRIAVLFHMASGALISQPAHPKPSRFIPNAKLPGML